MLVLNGFLALTIELAALYAVGRFGWQLFDALVARSVAALICIGLFALFWGLFAAPKSTRRLRQPWLAPFKAAMFATGALAFWATGAPLAALLLAVAGAGQIALALALGAL